MTQNGIIELQVINYVIKNKNLNILRDENLTAESFTPVYRNVVEYLFEHERTYGNTPDELTVVGKFDNYKALEVSESPNYLITKLKDFMAYNTAVESLKIVQELINEDKISEALTKLKEGAETSLKVLGGTSDLGHDIMKDASRLEEYETRLTGDGEETYSTGIDALDEAFGGLLMDDVVIVFARLGNGKSYFMTFLAEALHRQGLNVMFYTGEMGRSQVGYRLDSLSGHFSNRALLFGKHMDDSSFAKYKTHVERLKNSSNYFTVIEPSDLGGRFMNVNDVRKFLDNQKPDVVFIDQLSLMEDVRSTKNTPDRIKYGNIMADLRVLSNTYRVPIIVTAQANRMSATKNDDGETMIPEMAHIAESDAIGHHCTRAVAFCTVRTEEDPNVSIMKVAVRKNRHGTLPEFKMEVNFDKGIFQEVKHKQLRAAPEGGGEF